MVVNHPTSGATYRAQLADVVRRASDLEARARREYSALNPADPQHASWVRIERRYATIRGNAQHLLLVHEQRLARLRQPPLARLRRYLNLF